MRNTWAQGRSCSLPLLAPRPRVERPFHVVHGLIRRRRVFVALAGNRDSKLPGLPVNRNLSSPSPAIVSVSPSIQTLSSAPPPIQLLKAQGFRPSPELGLLSLLFGLSMAIGAIFSLAIISIPTINAFRRLVASVDKLSQVVAEEVPGTLSSFKLSALEINELTLQLSKLRTLRKPAAISTLLFEERRTLQE